MDTSINYNTENQPYTVYEDIKDNFWDQNENLK